jgi:NAD(P)-dependent dehydrogenase (short-subunit alcohol dehydrogenase family)
MLSLAMKTHPKEVAMDSPSSGISLAGQVAIITGGGRGLGRAMALALSGAGASVAVAARSEDQLQETVAEIKSRGGRAIAFVVDVTDHDAIKGMVQEVDRQLGSVDLLVNNAGVIQPIGPTWEVDPDEWWKNLDVNVRGPFLCARAVLPEMIRRKCGRIVNIASYAGVISIPYGSAYVVAKTALIRFSENLAAETREHNIQVFAVDPGTVRTAMAEYLLESELGQRWTPWFRTIFDDGNDVSAERSAQLVLSLASGRADALSGCFLSVYDDLPELARRAEELKKNEQHILRLRR